MTRSFRLFAIVGLAAAAAAPVAAQTSGRAHAMAEPGKPTSDSANCRPGSDGSSVCSISNGSNMQPGESNSPMSGGGGSGDGGGGGSGSDDAAPSNGGHGQTCGAGMNPVQRRAACRDDSGDELPRPGVKPVPPRKGSKPGGS